MRTIPLAKTRRTSYENIVAQCPCCSKDSIFNRASDLKTFEPIGGLDVTCQNDDCRKEFRIVGDSVNNAHEMFIFDSYELIEGKHYMASILNLAQAYELFFSLFFRVELLYKPFAHDPEQEISELNQLSGDLQRRMRGYSFSRMRALFLDFVLTGPSPKSVAQARVVLSGLPHQPVMPDHTAIEGLTDTKLVSLLKALKETSINMLRNEVVHKRAYRPTRHQVDEALMETRSILLPLTSRLQLHDDINWYLNNRR
jgi:hypothetical protein